MAKEFQNGETYELHQFDVPEQKGYARKPARTIEVTKEEFNSIMNDPIQMQLHHAITIPGEPKSRKDEGDEGNTGKKASKKTTKDEGDEGKADS